MRRVFQHFSSWQSLVGFLQDVYIESNISKGVTVTLVIIILPPAKMTLSTALYGCFNALFIESIKIYSGTNASDL